MTIVKGTTLLKNAKWELFLNLSQNKHNIWGITTGSKTIHSRTHSIKDDIIIQTCLGEITKIWGQPQQGVPPQEKKFELEQAML